MNKRPAIIDRLKATPILSVEQIARYSGPTEIRIQNTSLDPDRSPARFEPFQDLGPGKMPWSGYDYIRVQAQLATAEATATIRFPTGALIEGAAGWYFSLEVRRFRPSLPSLGVFIGRRMEWLHGEYFGQPEDGDMRIKIWRRDAPQGVAIFRIEELMIGWGPKWTKWNE